MIRFEVKLALMFAACAGLAFHADACPKRKVSTNEKRDPQIPRFAIAGLVDVDNDGESDLEVVRHLIKRGGGQVDAELRIDGRLTGRLRSDTGYILLGKLPDETTVTPGVAKEFDAFMRRAGELSIPVIPLKKLWAKGNPRRSAESDVKSIFRPRHPSRQPY
jgi:hypothetical protein